MALTLNDKAWVLNNTAVKREIVTAVSARTKMTPQQCQCVIEEFIKEIVRLVLKGHNVHLQGFGVFKIKEMPARIAVCNVFDRRVKGEEPIRALYEAYKKPIFQFAPEIIKVLRGEKKFTPLNPEDANAVQEHNNQGGELPPVSIPSSPDEEGKDIQGQLPVHF